MRRDFSHLFPLISVLLSITSCVSYAAAGTYTAASCSYSDVNAIINGPTHTLAAGDTIIVPACSSTTWATALTITVPTSSSSGTVTTFEGATVCTGSGDPASNDLACADNTTIMNNVAGNNPMINIVPPATGEFRMTGFTLGSSTTVYHGYVNVTSTTGSTNPGVRIDDNHFIGASGGTGDLEFDGWVYGVVDHNIFYAIAGDENMVRIYNGGNWNGSTDGFGHASWADGPHFGSNQAIYLEQNYFYSISSAGYQIIDDCSVGGHFVARFNTIGYHMVPYTHGTTGGAAYRGCRALEIYGNTATWNSGNSSDQDYTFMQMESGTGLLWGNTINGQNSILNEANSRSGIYSQTAPPNGWGEPGTMNGGPSNWDQNATSSNGYPALDMPGRGKGDLLTGSFPTLCDSTTRCTTYDGTWPNQEIEPWYAWANTASSALQNYWQSTDTAPLMKNNRDYYFQCGSYNSSCSSFTGAAGVGSGTLASIPSTCTAGVGYWATDQGSWNQSGNGFGNGVLYLCTATNIWNPSYTPYTYPNPLTNTGARASPTPPTGLTATVQ